MTDLTAVLPGFPIQQYVRLLPSLEKKLVTTADLLTLDHVEIAKRANLPVLDTKRLCNAVLESLQASLGVKEAGEGEQASSTLRKTGKDIVTSWNTISTLDDELDRVLGGGIPTGYITEVVGESGAGKTQFLLTLLLAAQLPRPQGLSSSALYISTESALPITRLSQLLRTHCALATCDPTPTLDSIISIVTPDLESQDHILRFQVPVAIERHNVRLIILDSVAANYRAEFERPGAGTSAGQTSGANMAQRSSELVKLGQLLREIAQEHDIAVVVANQVADRFHGGGGSIGNSPMLNRYAQSSPLTRRGHANIPSANSPERSSAHSQFTGTPDPLSLDHQQRWFTGWGDDPHPSHLTIKSLKTPSLGLIWTSQIACRIALIKRPVYGPGILAGEENERGEPVLRKWRRWMRVVFAPHVAPSGPGLRDAVEFKICAEGLKAVRGKNADVDDENDLPTLPA
ncbi:P-loop containing nucleoside triphosphate hydrolase protein [Tricladium varicosporioides]|nr:P-loop containing nucleoside triphosphate hydrolase protein [Hymenoscyphus varicosporioides]